MEKVQKYILRSPDAGVFYGEMINEIDSSRIAKLSNVRQIWSWEGAATLMQLSKTGSLKPDKCRITVAVNEMTICNVSEIIPCTEEAMANLDAIPEWKEE